MHQSSDWPGFEPFWLWLRWRGLCITVYSCVWRLLLCYCTEVWGDCGKSAKQDPFPQLQQLANWHGALCVNTVVMSVTQASSSVFCLAFFQLVLCFLVISIKPF